MPNLGAPEILVILLVALIFLGPQRLPEVGRQIGGALRELRKVQTDVRSQLDQALHSDEEPTPAPTAETPEPGGRDDNAPPPPTTSFS
jgi:sec-independent protein translocase protein TatA